MKNSLVKNIFKLNGLRKSFGFAVEGIIYLFFFHRNMRIIFLTGLIALLLGFYFKLKGLELVSLSLTVTIVFMAEIFNTAVEMMMNIISEEHQVKIKIIKDIAAGIVLIACVNAFAVGYILFIKRLLYG